MCTSLTKYHVRDAKGIEQRIAALKAAPPLTTDEAIIAPNALLVRALITQLRGLLHAVPHPARGRTVIGRCSCVATSWSAGAHSRAPGTRLQWRLGNLLVCRRDEVTTWPCGKIADGRRFEVGFGFHRWTLSNLGLGVKIIPHAEWPNFQCRVDANVSRRYLVR